MSLSAAASNLLARYGEAVVLSHQTGGVVDPATGQVTTAATTVTVNGIGHAGKYSASEVDGTDIRSGDIRLTLGVLASRPQVGWSVAIDGKTYRVMNLHPYRQAGEDRAYIVQLRAQ